MFMSISVRRMRRALSLSERQMNLTGQSQTIGVQERLQRCDHIADQRRASAVVHLRNASSQGRGGYVALHEHLDGWEPNRLGSRPNRHVT